MRNNETDACKTCRRLSEDGNKPQCETVEGTSCLSKDRAIIVLLSRIEDMVRMSEGA